MEVTRRLVLPNNRHCLIKENRLPCGSAGKEPACQCRRRKRCRFNPWVGKIPWRSKWQPTPVFLPGESCRQRSLVGYSPWGRRESDTAEATEHVCLLSYYLPLSSSQLLFFHYCPSQPDHFSPGPLLQFPFGLSRS